MSGERYTLLAALEPGGERLLPAALSDQYLVEIIPSHEIGERLRQKPVDAVLVWSDRHTGGLAEQLRRWKAQRPKTQFLIVLERTPPAASLVELMHAGAQNVLDRPGAAELAAALEALAERIQFVRIHQMERLQVRQSVQYAGLVGESPEMIRIYDQMLRAAELHCPVLILGETGTGKGLVAHAIHALSSRSGKPFVTVDCGCLAPSLIESELYGAARGAYTGAIADRSGLVQAAQEGTLFLDEIGELPLGMQPKLLRLLEEGEIRRLGSPRAVAVDVRILSATNHRLEDLIAAEQFRLDLYYRLNVLSLELPPLRQRPQDIPLLARHFASRHVVHGEPAALTDAAIEELLDYPWPGNVRELKNCIEAAIAAAGGHTIQPHHLPRRFRRGAAPVVPGADTVNLRELERRAILRALEMAGQDRARAARLLGIGKTTLYRKLKQMRAPEPPRARGIGQGYLM